MFHDLKKKLKIISLKHCINTFLFAWYQISQFQFLSFEPRPAFRQLKFIMNKRGIQLQMCNFNSVAMS